MNDLVRKRLEAINARLTKLRIAFINSHESDAEEAYGRYKDRLDHLHSGWHTEMKRRAGLLRESDRSFTRPVWEMVANIREVMGDEHGDEAAKIALNVLEPVHRQKKSLSSCKAV